MSSMDTIINCFSKVVIWCGVKHGAPAGVVWHDWSNYLFPYSLVGFFTLLVGFVPKWSIEISKMLFASIVFRLPKNVTIVGSAHFFYFLKSF